MKNNQTNYEAKSSIKWAYFQYLFNSFWRRPVGYIIPAIYLLALAVIFLIVPKVMNNSPLFIWNITSFNVPILVLFFVAAMCATLAITIFKISQEDGTELSISAKPLTKGSMVGLKVLVYLIVMIVITGLTVAVVALIKPIFGMYSDTNSHGIKADEYKGILLSMLIGNTVNILLFSGLSVFVSMVGGQVITMISSIGLAFIMVMLNFIYGYVVKTPHDVISDNYNSDISSHATFTKRQYNNKVSNPVAKNYATIQCYINEEGEELNHYDTYEYWLKAEKESKSSVVTYLDFGNQLSSLCSSFGLEDAKLDDVKKMYVGYDIAYKYNFDQDSHVGLQTNIDDGNYPICVYAWSESQGKYYPVVRILGTSLGGLTSWYLQSSVYSLDFYSVSMVSASMWSDTYPGRSIANKLKAATYSMGDLYLTDEQLVEANNFCELFIKTWDWDDGNWFNDYLTTSSTGIWEGNYTDLSIDDKFLVNSKLQLAFAVHGQEYINQCLTNYLGPTHKFPFSTKDIVQAYVNDTSLVCRGALSMAGFAFHGFKLGTVDGVDLYSRLLYSSVPYSESFLNMYTYNISSIYSPTALAAIWGSVAFALFLIAIIVYKKTDFK